MGDFLRHGLLFSKNSSPYSTTTSISRTTPSITYQTALTTSEIPSYIPGQVFLFVLLFITLQPTRSGPL
jgi:hypothetical protein